MTSSAAQRRSLADLGAGPAVLARLPGTGEPCRVLAAQADRARLLVVAATGEVREREVRHLAPLVPGTWGALADGRLTVLEPVTRLVRTAAGRSTREQVLAVDIDIVLICTPADARLRPGRLERWLALVWDSGATPAVVWTKADLVDAEHRGELLRESARLAPGASVHLVGLGEPGLVDAARAELAGPGRTLALVGSSGAGKTTLLNALATANLATGDIRGSNGRGRHTTVARVLVPLPGGGAVLDTPGLRGLALHDAGRGLAGAYPEVADLALDCRFSDCRHDTEPGCAVREAVTAGILEADRVARHDRLARELAWQEARRDAGVAAARKAEVRRQGRVLKRQFNR